MTLTAFTPLLDGTTRTVSSGTRPEGVTRTVTLSRTFAAPIDETWDALTNAERIPRWFQPVSGDLRPGGRYQVEGNAGGTVEWCDAPRAFGATWEFGGTVSWIEVDLTVSAGDGDTTQVTLKHIAVVSPHWDRYGPGAVGIGWDMSLLGLILHLEQVGTLSPDEAMGWMMSEDGAAFMARSNELWAEADIANGEDPERARTAAANTLAFYTGTEQPAGE
ncbi:MAG: SRPBCC family protein [Thermomicrobiales bacterium]